MAAIRLTESQVACISKKNIIVIQLGGTESHVYTSKKPSIEEAEKKRQPQGNEDGSEQVLASGYSPTGRYFVSCDDYKQLTLWAVHRNGAWETISTRSVARRVTSLTFQRDETFVLVADKSGDVFRFSLSQPDEVGELLMGHVSMLLDLVFCSGDDLVVSCDRDEKIRFTHYPNAHSIHSYCLGHTDFVSRLVYVEAEDVIISGSGDGTVRIWNYHSSRQICETDCRTHLARYINVQKEESTKQADGGGGESTYSEDRKTKLDSRENDNLDLSCLVCCQKQKLLAVGFERFPVILIYKFTSQLSKNNQMTLTFEQEITLQGHLWDASFDTKGQLWLLQAFEDRPLNVYKKLSSNEEKTEKFIPLDASHDVDKILPTVTAFSKHWNLLSECLEGDTLFSVLHKVRIDNGSFYQERKQQKMDEQKQRYKEKAERRKLVKGVLPPGESNTDHMNKMDTEVAPPTECSSPNSKRNKLVE